MKNYLRLSLLVSLSASLMWDKLRYSDYRTDLPKVWHAWPKWHAKDFFFLALGMFHFVLPLLPDQRLCIVKDMCVYSHV